RDFVAWFASQMFTEPHSTRGQDDVVAWAGDTSPEMLIETVLHSATPRLGEYWRAVAGPVLIIHGEHDAIIPVANSRHLAATRPATELVAMQGCGHALHIRDAVKTNLVIGEFLAAPARPAEVGRQVDART